MNVLKFYKDNISNDEYYYKFYDEIITIPEREKQKLLEAGFEAMDEYKNFDFFDDEDVINKFKYLCQPDVSMNETNKIMFHLVSYYLYKNGYVIKEFPYILCRPPMDPLQFTYHDIRTKIINDGGMRSNGQVPFSKRRLLISKLTFSQGKKIIISEDLDKKFMDISTRNASFESMTTDEKLKEIINMIEHLLKVNGKYISLDYATITDGCISDEDIILYKDKIQCFRHASEESLIERQHFSNAQKEFLIDYGVLICNLIYNNK